MTGHECLDCSHRWDEPDDEQPDDGDWSRVDLTGIAKLIRSGDFQPITPEVLAVEGGLPLFYRGRINSIFGESGTGKSWAALAALAEVARAGEHGLYLDWEDNPQGITERLVMLGLTDEEIGRVDYRNPDTGIGQGIGILEERNAGAYGVVVIDSSGEAMAAGMTDSNADGEVAQWMVIAKAFARLPGAPAVVIVDHVPKDTDAPRAYAIGSQRKRAAINGASYRVDTIREPAKGRDGKLKITVAKDRPGNRPKGSTAAELELRSAPGRVDIELHVSDAQAAAEHGERFRPTVLMERVSRYLEGVPAASQRGVCKAVSGKTEGLRSALEVLVEEGYARLTPMGYEHVAPFREAVDNSSAPPAPHRAPGAPQGAPKTPRPAPPPYPSGGGAGDAGIGPTQPTLDDAGRAPDEDHLEGPF